MALLRGRFRRILPPRHLVGIFRIGSRQILEKIGLHAKGVRVIGVSGNGGIEKLHGLADRVLATIVSIEGCRTKVEILRGAVRRSTQAERGLSGLSERDAERLGDVGRNVGLDLDLVGRRAVVGLLPALKAVAAANQLRADSDHSRERRTLPVKIFATPSFDAMTFVSRSLTASDDARPITCIPMRVSAERSSSAMPSEKYA